LDGIFKYSDTFLKPRLLEMGVFPTEYAAEMMKYYYKKRKEILESATAFRAREAFWFSRDFALHSNK
jgi:hypothetical protein